MTLAPLEEPAYEPRYRPENGRPPAVVAKWAPRSQLRWFRRFYDELTAMRFEEWARFYCESVEHRGICCVSCRSDEDYFGWPVYDDHCCCVGYRASKR